MLYQKLLPASTPYVVYITSKAGSFPMHKHYEIELIYSPKNSNLSLTIDQTDYIIKDESLSIVGSLVPHGTSKLDEDNDVMILELGPAFLKKHFSRLSDLDLSDPIINLKAQNEDALDLKRCLEEIYSLYKVGTTADELLILSNIYRICANLLKLKSEKDQKRNKNSYKKLEKALDHIHINYSGRITLEETATLVGYSKGNFCKAFKEATGMSFHAYLNNYRITNACYLLSDTDMAIGDIATTVGFTEFKTFCRVFKVIIGTTPSEFRQQRRN